jgi:hypothetical protein
MIDLAALRVTILGNDSPLRSTLAGVRATLTSFGRGLNIPLGITGLSGIGAIGFGIGKALKAASNLTEEYNKVGVVFGDSGKIVVAASERMYKAVGVVRSESLSAMGEFGNLLQGMGGMSSKAAAELSVKLAQAGVDAGSLFNKNFSLAFRKITSAILGQSRPIAAFGAVTKESAVKAEAFALGIAKANSKLTEQQKVAARASLVLKALKVAAGDAVTTHEKFAGATRELGGRLTGFFESLGQALMPAAESMMAGLNRMTGAVGAWVERNQNAIAGFMVDVQMAFESFGGTISKSVGILAEWGVNWGAVGSFVGDVIERIGVMLRNWSAIMEYTGGQLVNFGINVVEAVQWAGGALATFGGYVANNWRQVIVDGLTALWEFWKGLFLNIKNLVGALWEYLRTGQWTFEWTPVLDGFREMISKFPEIAGPEFTDMSEDLKAKLEKAVGENEVGRIQRKADAAAQLAKDKTLGKKGEREPLPDQAGKRKKPEIMDLKEFADSLMKGSLGALNPAERTAKSTELMVAALGELPSKIGKAVGGKLATSGVGTLAGPA